METAASWLARWFGPKRALQIAAHIDPASPTIALEGGEAVQPPLTIAARIVPGHRAELVVRKEAVHE